VIPDLTVLCVVLFVLALSGVMRRFIFDPIFRVMRERERLVTSARELAGAATAQAEEATAEASEKIHAARAEIYRQMDEKRQRALAQHGDDLAAARQEAEAKIDEARNRLQDQMKSVKQQLTKQAGVLGAAAAERILGRKTS